MDEHDRMTGLRLEPGALASPGHPELGPLNVGDNFGPSWIHLLRLVLSGTTGELRNKRLTRRIFNLIVFLALARKQHPLAMPAAASDGWTAVSRLWLIPGWEKYRDKDNMMRELLHIFCFDRRGCLLNRQQRHDGKYVSLSLPPESVKVAIDDADLFIQFEETCKRILLERLEGRTAGDVAALLRPLDEKFANEAAGQETLAGVVEYAAKYRRLRELFHVLRGPGEIKVSTHRMPRGGRYMFGRKEELGLLDEAWSNDKITIVAVMALGGVGKSALVRHWVNRRAPSYRDAHYVFVWSFYSQGARDAASASSDLFVAKALQFFGDADPDKGSPIDRAERLAQLIRRRRSLLVLDGMEPLQDARDGRVRDRALAHLLRALAARMDGLCIVTARPPFTELEDFEHGTCRRLDLGHLSEEAGAELLESCGVEGGESELRAASREYRGHALALMLLGNYLSLAHEGEIRRLDRVTITEDESRDGKHAWAIIGEYDRWFGPGPNQELLRLLGLFNRPATADCIAALRRPPAIPGITEAIVALEEREWSRCLARLRRAKLLNEGDRTGELDTHPIIREYFGSWLARENPAAFRAAHSRLFEHLRDHGKPSPDVRSDRLEDIQPILLAIRHGCEDAGGDRGLDRRARRAVSLQAHLDVECLAVGGEDEVADRLQVVV